MTFCNTCFYFKNIRKTTFEKSKLKKVNRRSRSEMSLKQQDSIKCHTEIFQVRVLKQYNTISGKILETRVKPHYLRLAFALIRLLKDVLHADSSEYEPMIYIIPTCWIKYLTLEIFSRRTKYLTMLFLRGLST